MRRTSILILSLALLGAGCDELSSYDDPRESRAANGGGGGGNDTDGTCSGLPLECNQLTETFCANADGCSWRQGCFEPERDTCFARSTEATCEDGFEPFCKWEEDQSTCFAPRSNICDLETNQSDCQDSFFDCRWGSTCEGDPRSCFGFRDRNSCLGQIGCSWR